ncbi:MAG: hypothetical protein M3487_07560 [Actinomycetota bacterium]|nr:hypothetical protein [Actinomycetota bacterium]
MASFPPPGPIAAFTEQLVSHDLPGLPADRRHAVTAFTVRRVAGLPTPMRLGVGIVATAVDGGSRVFGRRRMTGFLAAHPLPLFGEYVRLVRSLAYAYVWETWPATAVDGQPATAGDGRPR